MSTIEFDPFGGPTLADPYPQFAHFVEHRPVFWSDELGYWVVSALRRPRAGCSTTTSRSPQRTRSRR